MRSKIFYYILIVILEIAVNPFFYPVYAQREKPLLERLQDRFKLPRNQNYSMHPGTNAQLQELGIAPSPEVSCNMGNQQMEKSDSPTKEQVGEATSSTQISYDPNEIIGPEGYDSVRWLSINDVLNYTILFENDPEFATAAAQKVDVRFDFPNKAWMKGFGIGGYSFSNMSWTVAKPSNAYQQRIDLKDSLGYYVDLIAGLDVARQQGFWTFTTIDPETGYAPCPAEALRGPAHRRHHQHPGQHRLRPERHHPHQPLVQQD